MPFKIQLSNHCSHSTPVRWFIHSFAALLDLSTPRLKEAAIKPRCAQVSEHAGVFHSYSQHVSGAGCETDATSEGGGLCAPVHYVNVVVRGGPYITFETGKTSVKAPAAYMW